jgi:excisionase family DNA binding protein
MNVDEASRLTGLAKNTLYGLCSRREIPHKKMLSKLRFDREELESWIASKTEVREVKTND